MSKTTLKFKELEIDSETLIKILKAIKIHEPRIYQEIISVIKNYHEGKGAKD